MVSMRYSPRPHDGQASRSDGHDRSANRSRLPLAADLLVQVGLVFTCGLLYFAVRGVTEGSTNTAVENGYQILRMESVIGVAIEETAQNLVLSSHALTTFTNWVYIWGHWPVIIATLVWLYRTSRRDYVLLRNAMFVSGAIGLVIFALYPVAPPRHLPDMFVDTVTELSRSYRVLQPPHLINEYAALPSLHVGWNLLVGIFLVRVGRNQIVRTLGVVSPILMVIAVVATANHYVVDGIVGSTVALVGLAGSYGLWRAFYDRPSFDRASIGHQAGDQVEVVRDDPGHSPGTQELGSLSVGHAPGEHVAAGAQLADEPGGEQAVADGDAVRPPR